MKAEYKKPEINITLFEAVDIVTGSIDNDFEVGPTVPPSPEGRNTTESALN